MCRRLREISRVVIERLGLCHHLAAEMRAQELRRVEVHFPPQYLGQLPLHAEKGKPRHMVRFELDQYVDIALLPQVAMNGGPEDGKFADMMPLAEIVNFFSGYFQTTMHGTALSLRARPNQVFTSWGERNTEPLHIQLPRNSAGLRWGSLPLHHDERPGVAGDGKTELDDVRDLDPQIGEGGGNKVRFLAPSPPLHGDDPAAFPEEREGNADEGGDVGEGAGDDPVEMTGILAGELFPPGVERLEVVEAKEPGGVALKDHLLLHRINRDDLEAVAGDL